MSYQTVSDDLNYGTLTVPAEKAFSEDCDFCDDAQEKEEQEPKKSISLARAECYLILSILLAVFSSVFFVLATLELQAASHMRSYDCQNGPICKYAMSHIHAQF